MSIFQRNLKLLLIEDNPGDQILLKRYLQRSNMPIEAFVVVDRLSEVASLSDKRFDLVFLDLTLPDSSGLDSFIKIKKYFPLTPIIVLSGLNDEETATETISLGAQDYLMKGEFDEKLLSKSIHYSIERKKIGQHLEENNQRYEIVNKATGDIIWDWNLQTNEMYYNERFNSLLGYTKPHITAEWFFNHLHPADQERMQNYVSVIIDQGIKKWGTEYRIRSADGSYRNVQIRAYTVFNDAGKPVRLIGAATDVTEKRELEKQLIEQKLSHQKNITETTIQAQEKERESIGKELHDNINQVLATVKMFLDIVKTDTDQDRKSDLINRSHENVSYAIEEIRKLSKSLVAPSLGDLGLIDSLNELVEEIHLSGHVDISLQYNKPIEDSVDPKLGLMIYRIVQEQINNILKYSKATEVSIHLKFETDKICLSVIDNGVGFDPSVKRKGIGLKNIENRVEFYAGKLEIVSAPGKGCTISICIPLINQYDE